MGSAQSKDGEASPVRRCCSSVFSTGNHKRSRDEQHQPSPPINHVHIFRYCPIDDTTDDGRADGPVPGGGSSVPADARMGRPLRGRGKTLTGNGNRHKKREGEQNNNKRTIAEPLQGSAAAAGCAGGDSSADGFPVPFKTARTSCTTTKKGKQIKGLTRSRRVLLKMRKWSRAYSSSCERAQCIDNGRSGGLPGERSESRSTRDCGGASPAEVVADEDEDLRVSANSSPSPLIPPQPHPQKYAALPADGARITESQCYEEKTTTPVVHDDHDVNAGAATPERLSDMHRWGAGHCDESDVSVAASLDCVRLTLNTDDNDGVTTLEPREPRQSVTSMCADVAATRTTSASSTTTTSHNYQEAALVDPAATSTRNVRNNFEVAVQLERQGFHPLSGSPAALLCADEQHGGKQDEHMLREQDAVLNAEMGRDVFSSMAAMDIDEQQKKRGGFMEGSSPGPAPLSGAELVESRPCDEVQAGAQQDQVRNRFRGVNNSKLAPPLSFPSVTNNRRLRERASQRETRTRSPTTSRTSSSELSDASQSSEASGIVVPVAPGTTIPKQNCSSTSADYVEFLAKCTSSSAGSSAAVGRGLSLFGGSSDSDSCYCIVQMGSYPAVESFALEAQHVRASTTCYFEIDRKLACKVRGSAPKREYIRKFAKKKKSRHLKLSELSKPQGHYFGIYCRVSVWRTFGSFLPDQYLGEALFHVPSGAPLKGQEFTLQQGEGEKVFFEFLMQLSRTSPCAFSETMSDAQIIFWGDVHVVRVISFCPRLCGRL